MRAPAAKVHGNIFRRAWAVEGGGKGESCEPEGGLMISPSDRILEFLRGLPDTIRENVYAQLVSFLSDTPLWEVTDWEAIVGGLVKPGSSLDAFHAAVAVGGVLDFILARNPSLTTQANTWAARETGSPIIQKVALQGPLRERHFLKARGRWENLRKSSLRSEALHKYEATLMAALMRSTIGR